MQEIGIPSGSDDERKLGALDDILRPAPGDNEWPRAP